MAPRGPTKVPPLPRVRPLQWALVATLLVALALPGAAVAGDAGSATAASGAVHATLTWKAAEFGVSDPRLVVVHAGTTVFDGSPVASSDSCREGGCTYAPSGKRDGPLQVRDLNGDGEPEVLVDAYSGGAHCCALTEILRFTGAAYATLEAFWGNTGYDLSDLDGDGRPEFVAADDAFAGAFTSYAGSFFPPLVLDYDAATKGGFRDVATTRRWGSWPPTPPTSICWVAGARCARICSAPGAAATYAPPRAVHRAATTASCWPSCASRAIARRRRPGRRRTRGSRRGR
jgi:hypothetical protein